MFPEWRVVINGRCWVFPKIPKMGGSWLNNIRAQKSEKLQNDPYLQLIMAECLLHPLFFTFFLDISTAEENAELAEVIEETEKVNFWNT